MFYDVRQTMYVAPLVPIVRSLDRLVHLFVEWSPWWRQHTNLMPPKPPQSKKACDKPTLPSSVAPTAAAKAHPPRRTTRSKTTPVAASPIDEPDSLHPVAAMTGCSDAVAGEGLLGSDLISDK
jgi:hypothetical protein